MLYELNEDGKGVKVIWKNNDLDPHHDNVVLVDGKLYEHVSAAVQPVPGSEIHSKQNHVSRDCVGEDVPPQHVGINIKQSGREG